MEKFEFLQKIIFENKVLDYLIFLLYLILGYFLINPVSSYLRKLIFKIVGNKNHLNGKSEFDILLALVKKENKILSRDQLLNQINDDTVLTNDRIIDVHINNIRKKLSNYKNSIETVIGLGYMIKKDNFVINE